MKLVTAICVSIGFLLGVSSAQEKKPASETQIREWIEQLANARSPRRYESPEDRLTKVERKSLEPVQAAFRNLTSHFRESLPFLIEHLHDKRFSYPREHPTSGVFYNQTVGDACHEIIQGKVLPTGLSFIDSRDIGVWVTLPIDKDWYKDVSKMTLYEMQVDSIDRLLKAPRLPKVTAEQWEKGLAEVRKFREGFVRSGEPVDRTFGPPIEGK
ncbi:MAG: hypothetical protein SFV81_13800 [Pirellulaceae bacterium]|nr:hypothetical protein [Pirellulaceae bacterium]